MKKFPIIKYCSQCKGKGTTPVRDAQGNVTEQPCPLCAGVKEEQWGYLIED